MTKINDKKLRKLIEKKRMLTTFLVMLAINAISLVVIIVFMVCYVLISEYQFYLYRKMTIKVLKAQLEI